MTAATSDIPVMSEQFGQKLRRRRTALGLSQNEVAETSRLHQSRVSKWENGEGEPGPTQIHHLSRALRTTADWLCDPNAADDAADSTAAATPRPQGYTPGEAALAEMVRILGAEECVRRVLERPVETRKRADPAPEEKPNPPAEEGPSYGRPITPGRRTGRSAE